MTGTSHAECPDGIAVGKRAVVEITGHNGGSLTGVRPQGTGASSPMR